MDLQEQYPDLSSFLLYSDGLKPIFFIVTDAINNGPPKLREVALEAIEHVRRIHATGARSSDPEYMNALFPVLLEALDSENPVDNSNALWALGVIVKHGNLPGIPPSVVKFFNTKSEDILSKVVWVVQMYTHKGLDITDSIPFIEPLLQHKDYWIRRMASDALSEHEIRTGQEDRLSVIDGLYDQENIDSNYWRVLVYHRRIHSADDTPMKQPKYTVHFTTERMCGACGFKKARCIFYWDDSGTGWRDRTSEYICPECSKYTMYRYVD